MILLNDAVSLSTKNTNTFNDILVSYFVISFPFVKYQVDFIVKNSFGIYFAFSSVTYTLCEMENKWQKYTETVLVAQHTRCYLKKEVSVANRKRALNVHIIPVMLKALRNDVKYKKATHLWCVRTQHLLDR